MTGLATLKRGLEILGGVLPIPGESRWRLAIVVARAAWWLVLLLLGLAFSGRTTKFIYIDF